MDVAQPPGGRPIGVRYVISVGPADVGRRVVLRRRLQGGGMTDIIGHVQRWADGVVAVVTRTGLVEVAEADLVAGKRVPPAPPLRTPRA